MNCKQTHKAKELILKTALIDNNVGSVVEWINSLSCFTLNSCQGDNSSKHPCLSKPHVCFVCWDEESLKHIISVTKSFCRKHNDSIKLIYRQNLVDHFALSQPITLEMNNEEILPLFCEHIKGLSEINKKGTISEDVLDDCFL